MAEEIEHYTFILPPSPWSKKPYRSRWKMSIEYAAAKYPGATPIPETREVIRGITTQLHSSPPMPGSDAWKALHGEG